ncbi:hypothetical protein CALCODRAFT_485985 [Calocera cornea HHB12733]|uniref:ATPase domain-containing protein n=1 Tax=Calocera cornea HHB12733 TaxID=1353952 RepID=A0A165E155_9BASI|nr:hypothetical protein CALCODRAFT_485985 [Calocera cornea HHB12733]
MISRGCLLARPRVLHPILTYQRHRIYARSFWGIGEIIGVLTAPGQTLQQLSDVRKELQNAKAEMDEAKERDRLPPVRTFVQAEGYFPRKKEEAVVRRILEGPPEFTVIFGATSVGKTAMLRHILTSPRYFVLPLDLRIAGFADPQSMYFALSMQFEQYFLQLGDLLEGYKEECENIALSFKHQRLDVTRRVDGDGRPVGTSDTAALLELLQNALVRYWSFDPSFKEEDNEQTEKVDDNQQEEVQRSPEKKVPVWFIDEAHKLPSLVDEDADYLKTLIDGMVVLTKQERLCHVVHATSDSLYMETLVGLSVASHVKFMRINDPDKETTMDYVRHQLLRPFAQDHQTEVLNHFEDIYEVIGGKLLHWESGVREWADEGIPITQSSHVSQAYILVNNFLHPSAITELPTHFLKSSLRLFERLVSPTDRVQYFDALHQFGPELVTALLQSGLVEIRWDGRIGDEPKKNKIMEGDVRKPLLEPMTPAIRWAMGKVLKEWDATSSSV